jgi:putative iron-only hydrogenase system regulator
MLISNYREVQIMRKVAIISAVLDDPHRCQRAFNDVIAEYMHLLKGQMSIPLLNEGITLVSLVALGSLEDINNLTARLNKIEGVSVKPAMSKKDF